MESIQQLGGAGLHLKIPLVQTVKRVSIKEQTADFPPQAVIAKDNVGLTINSAVFFKIIEPKKSVYEIENYISALETLSATTLRNIMGDMELDESLSSRETINSKMLSVLDEATDPWGIKVNRVEIQDILPPAQVQEAMERQVTAERNKRADILEAEGYKQSNILEAEGYKQKTILQAEADAKAVELEKNAEDNGIVAIREARPNDAVLLLRKLEAVKDMADGQATKIIVPSDLQGIAGLTEVISTVAKDKTLLKNNSVVEIESEEELTENDCED